jgi:hypothetical protein
VWCEWVTYSVAGEDEIGVLGVIFVVVLDHLLLFLFARRLERRR